MSTTDTQFLHWLLSQVAYFTEVAVGTERKVLHALKQDSPSDGEKANALALHRLLGSFSKALQPLPLSPKGKKDLGAIWIVY